MPTRGSRAHSAWVYRAILVSILVSLFTVLAVGEFSFQNSDERSLQSSFAARVTNGSRFLSTYVVSVLRREKALASLRLTGAVVTRAQFDDFAQDLQFGPSVLINSRGQVLDVLPRISQLDGAVPASMRASLAVALRGRASVSQASKVDQRTLVSFAVPFSTPEGLRVISGSLQLTHGPMVDFLQLLLSNSRTVVYLTDDSNRVIAAPPGPKYDVLPVSLVELGSTARLIRDGQFDVAVPVADTPWKLLATVPLSTLYASVEGSHRVVPWLVLLGFLLVCSAFGTLLLRSWEGKIRDLEIAGTDPLTKLDTRRRFFEQVDVIFAAAQRHHFDVAALMIDVDNFKDVNDQFGHYVGDRVLATVANCLRASLRNEDVGARWGGEEFAIVLPFTNHEQALHVAERVRNTVAVTSIDNGEHGPLFVTVSIGVAARVDDVSLTELLPRADHALFEAKDRGRNRVECFATS